MSLIAETKKLRELAQKEPRWIDEKGIAVSVDVGYLNALYTFALAMLEVLGMIREGDAAKIQGAIQSILNWYGDDQTPAGKDRLNVLYRLQKMAALMEKEMET